MVWNKIELENAIFARAAGLGAAVDGVQGTLVAEGNDVCLHLLICVYNAFFETENRAFWEESWEGGKCGFWENFCAQQRYPPLPLKRAFDVPFFAIDTEAELFLSKN